MGNAWGVFSHSNERWAISHLCDSAASEPTSSSTSVCTPYLHFKGGPWETALHIYMWLATLNEHVKIGKLLVTDSERNRAGLISHTTPTAPAALGLTIKAEEKKKKRYYIFTYGRDWISLRAIQGRVTLKYHWIFCMDILIMFQNCSCVRFENPISDEVSATVSRLSHA